MQSSRAPFFGTLLAGLGWMLAVAGVIVAPVLAAPVLLLLGVTPSSLALFLILTVVIFIMGPMFVVWGDRMRFPEAGHCPRCDYDLRGQFDPGCPECGWERSTS